MPAPPYLPQELVDSIIDYVDQDRLTLLSCALVSRSWLHSSRHHLFASIALSPHSQYKTPPQRLCQRLYQVLQESPAIIPYIRALQILDGGPSPNLRTGQWITSERTLPLLLKLLTHLRQLELGASSSCPPLQWKSLPFTLQNAVCTVLKLPSLTFFRLSSWTFPNLVSLAAVISSCRNMKGLSLSSVTVDEELDHHPRHSDSSTSLVQPKSIITLPPPPPSQPPLLVNSEFHDHDQRPSSSTKGPGFDNPDDEFEESGSNTVNTRVSNKRQRPYLEALTLDYVNFGYLGYWLFAPSQSPSPISFANLRELRISHSADPLVVEQVLLSIGASLEHLHLKPGAWDVFSFDLRHNPNLKSLRLTLENSETALSWCTTLLSSLSPSGFITSAHSSTSTDDDDLQLTHISLEFWTDLKKLSSSSTTASSSLSNSPNRSSSPSLIPSSSPPLSSSPLSSSLTLASPSSPLPTSSSTTSTPSRPETPTPPHRKRSLLLLQPTWSSLDSILSFLPTPLKQIDIGLFAQPTSSEFLRVKEVLRGIHARMMTSSSSSSSDIRDQVTAGEGEEGDEKESKQNGNVRMYQLGLKSQRSIGRICGPRLRSFEGGN